MQRERRNQVHPAAVPSRRSISAQLLRLPRTPVISSSSNRFQVTDIGRGSSEDDIQALSPPPPPPSYHNYRRPIKATTSTTSSFTVQETSIPTLCTSTIMSKPASPQSRSDDRSGKQSTDKPIPSVHPIDTLSRKLREQAMELTHVYEVLGKQNLQIKTYKQQLQDQKRQLEQVQELRRMSIDDCSKTPTSSRTAALGQQKRAAEMMVGRSCTGASLGQKREELDRKLKEAECDKKTYKLAAKRIEKALAELRVFQNDRMSKLLPSTGMSNQKEDGTANTSNFQEVLNEQRAYIRVLEEAVHLKATDFEITGHEELLVVLAELLQTIYEKEKDVEEKNGLLETIREQLNQEQQRQLETNMDLEATQKKIEIMKRRFHKQVDEIERQLLNKVRQVNELQNDAADAQRSQETLQSRLKASIKTQNAMQSKVDDVTRHLTSLNEQLEKTTLRFEETQRQSESLQNECAIKQSHLDEMNVLQEELLGSVDKYVRKVKKSRDKAEHFKAELESCKEKEIMAQNQLKEVARVSNERIGALQAEVEAAKLHTQELKGQHLTLEHEKNSLEGALMDVKEQLNGLIQARNTQQEVTAANAQKYCQIEAAVAELEVTLSTVLSMLVDTSQQQAKAEKDAGKIEADKYAFLLNHSVLRDLEICCHALTPLTTGKELIHSSALSCSLIEVISRVATIGERMVNEVTRALASWTRERNNLVEACATLDATALLCQHDMEKRHDEIRDCREQFVTHESEIDAYGVQLETLHEQLRCAYAECEAFRALKELAEHQDEALKVKQAMIRDLSAENDRLTSLKEAYASQVAANTLRIKNQEATINEQTQYADEREHALEKAATFVEEQNECNYQLQSQLAEMQSSLQKQNYSVKMLQEKVSAFSSQFLRLIRYYTSALQLVAATDPSVQNYLNLLDAEVQNGDVARLLEHFPALLETYFLTNNNHSYGDLLDDLKENQWKPNAPGAPTNCSQIKMSDKSHIETGPPKSSIQHSAPSPSASLEAEVNNNLQYLKEAEKGEAGMAEQWKLIRDAFQSYKINSDTNQTDVSSDILPPVN